MSRDFNIAFTHNHKAHIAQVKIVNENQDIAVVVATLDPDEDNSDTELIFNVEKEIMYEIQRGEMSRFKNELVQQISNL